MNPEPSDAARGAGGFGPPGAPFSPKKSRKNSSSGDPGGNCASGVPFAGAAAVVAWVVEMLTTTPPSRAASCEKTSAKGVSGASAPLGSGALIVTAGVGGWTLSVADATGHGGHLAKSAGCPSYAEAQSANQLTARATGPLSTHRLGTQGAPMAVSASTAADWVSR